MQISWSGLSSSVGGGEAVYSETVLDMNSHAAKDVPHAGRASLFPQLMRMSGHV